MDRSDGLCGWQLSGVESDMIPAFIDILSFVIIHQLGPIQVQ